ncbi:efflux RND transporter periplasmic adaptor subunit [Rhodopirellula sp. JC740]|uniref:Efflux RND transporter periplasmic adaptor subunit n=1 Tax=Rhodopirellula halodulae TaxID=2894198 RepID=A0ABS8NLM4_9BACT|nr:HlyD family efflux transporter periplasmic adaptor subunit [Rhodopirellula sp. JC740]MCC9644474.1 efflux RND transporter periplasmic adaptor subunit [Rhodopirellula sp. JC740]
MVSSETTTHPAPLAPVAASVSSQRASTADNAWSKETKTRVERFQAMWFAWITELAASPDRRAGAETLAERLSELLPEHTIRIGWGKKSLHRLYDGRLGWLGGENSIRQRYDAQWLAMSVEADEPLTQSKTYWDNGTLHVVLIPAGRQFSQTLRSDEKDDAENGQRCHLWIRPPSADAFDAKSFERMTSPAILELLATVFLNRPAKDHWGLLSKKASKWWSRRGLIGIGLLLLLIVTCIPMSYRVDATAKVTALNGRLVASPIDATLLTTLVQPGDRVNAGQTLVQLDGRPLRIELESVLAEIDEVQKDEDIALASGEIATAQLAGLRRKKLSRQAELLQDKLSKLDVVSPIDGIVIQGDLSRALGTPLEIGQTLMEVAPEGNVEIELEIPESEIGFVSDQAVVDLWFPALDEKRFESKVQSVWPAATIRDDANVFVAIAELPNDDASLRVGMQGEALVLGPTTPWIWKWIRTPIKRVGWMIGW